MSNRLGVDLQGKTVILSVDHYKGDEKARTFVCEDGFGCRTFTTGQAIYGHFVADGEKARVEGYEIEKLAELSADPIASER